MKPFDWILPGLGHLRHGFAKEARKYLLFMAAWLAVVVFLWDRLGALAGGDVPWAKPTETWVALGFLALALRSRLTLIPALAFARLAR